MNTNIPVSIQDTLGRSEMRKTIAGTGDLRDVKCYANDYWFGDVQCGGGISNMECCQVHHPETNQTYPPEEPQESPM